MAAVRLLAFFVLGLGLPASAGANIPAEFVERAPSELAALAFDTEYGRLIVAEFGKILRASADQECLRSRAIDPAALEAPGHELLVRNGARMLEIYDTLMDGGKFEAAFAARAGKNAKAEYVRLRRDPDVRRLQEISEPERLAELADKISETLDRNAVLANLRLTKMVSPLSTGYLIDRSPAEKSAIAQERFLESNKSPSLKRWMELQEALVHAIEEAQDRESFLKMGPGQMMPDAVRDLAALCVFPAPLKPAPGAAPVPRGSPR